jgi:hypothetical protein
MVAGLQAALKLKKLLTLAGESVDEELGARQGVHGLAEQAWGMHRRIEEVGELHNA